ncbi:MAG: tetratricopeptide repeat protein [Nanoarchaeota archaeon]
MPQTISLCMITKNEEKYLEQCLNSVKEIVDEIIIVDTGSSDKTKEIAKKFKAKIFDFKWGDDFSEARNESLKHATKDWILVLDADEIIDKDDLNKIKEIVQDKENDAFQFLQKNYTNDTSVAGFVNESHKKDNKAYAGWYGSFIVRLFKNNKNYKFEGTVHELTEHSVESKNGKIALANVSLHHYGNSNPEVVKKKRQFYLELCKRKVQKNKDAQSNCELGILYKENKDFGNAVKSFQKAVELDSKHRLALFELGVINEQQKNYDDAIKYYTESLRVKNDSEAYQNLGVCYMKKEDYKKAYSNFTKAMMLNPNKYTIYNNLGAVLEKIGNYDSAIQMLGIGVKLNPNNVIGFYNLGIALDKKGDLVSAIKIYEKAVELKHAKSDEIKKRISQIKEFIKKNPKHRYSFNVGG